MLPPILPAAELGVSRHTVRGAGGPAADGLVAGHQGVGTRVAAQAELTLSHSLQNIRSWPCTPATPWCASGVKDVTLDEATAEWIGAGAGETW